MSIPNWWGDWRQGLTPHTGNLQTTDLIECTQIVGGQPVNTVITGAQIINAAPGGGGDPTTIQSVTGSNVTGLNNLISASILIPANSIVNDNTIYIKAYILRSVAIGSGSTTCRFYTNTTNSLTGATFLGSASNMATTVRFQRFERNIFFDGTNLNCFNTGTSASNDYTISVFSAIPFNKTVDNYLIFSVQHSTSASDVASWKRVIVQKYA